jgi:hypothetical protein
MVYDSGMEGKAADGQRIIKLMADVCGQVEYLMKGQNPVGTIPAPNNLSPSAATKGATYLKLLAKPR